MKNTPFWVGEFDSKEATQDAYDEAECERDAKILEGAFRELEPYLMSGKDALEYYGDDAEHAERSLEFDEDTEDENFEE